LTQTGRLEKWTSRNENSKKERLPCGGLSKFLAVTFSRPLSVISFVASALVRICPDSPPYNGFYRRPRSLGTLLGNTRRMTVSYHPLCIARTQATKARRVQ
jgi:hypothetical protein